MNIIIGTLDLALMDIESVKNGQQIYVITKILLLLLRCYYYRTIVITVVNMGS